PRDQRRDTPCAVRRSWRAWYLRSVLPLRGAAERGLPAHGGRTPSDRDLPNRDVRLNMNERHDPEVRRESAYRRFGTRTPRCRACGEADWRVLTGTPPDILCYE